MIFLTKKKCRLLKLRIIDELLEVRDETYKTFVKSDPVDNTTVGYDVFYDIVAKSIERLKKDKII